MGVKRLMVALTTAWLFLSACSATKTTPGTGYTIQPSVTPTATPAPTVQPTPPDLTGEWRQVNAGASYQQAIITADRIEVYWMSPDSKSLYWAGSFTPSTSDGKYTWDSANDHSMTDAAMLASGNDIKIFTYDNEQISYKVSALGTTTTVRLERIK